MNCPKPGRPGAGLPGGVGQIHSARNLRCLKKDSNNNFVGFLITKAAFQALKTVLPLQTVQTFQTVETVQNSPIRGISTITPVHDDSGKLWKVLHRRQSLQGFHRLVCLQCLHSLQSLPLCPNPLCPKSSSFPSFHPSPNHVFSYPWVEKTEKELKTRIRCTPSFRT